MMQRKLVALLSLFPGPVNSQSQVECSTRHAQNGKASLIEVDSHEFREHC